MAAASQEQKMTQETTEQLAEKFMQKVLANEIKSDLKRFSAKLLYKYRIILFPQVFDVIYR